MTTFAPPTLDATLPEDVETLAFEALKGRVAHAIWGVESKTTLQNVWYVLQQNTPADNQPPQPQKREIGFLEGKARVIFADDWEMTEEELLGEE